jgi:preprotein translocase subunit SecA
LEQQIDRVVQSWLPKGKPNYEEMGAILHDIVPFDDASFHQIENQIKKITKRDEMDKFLKKIVRDAHAAREKQVGAKVMRQIEKFAYLGSIDHLWIDHLDQIEDLREGINLRAYGQRDPLVEFKNEAYKLFESLIDRIDEELSHRIFRIDVTAGRQGEIPLNIAKTNIDTSDMIGLAEPASAKKASARRSKLGRNDPCWCGSGKKWKKCHYPELPNA